MSGPAGDGDRALPSFDHPLHVDGPPDLPMALHGRHAVLDVVAGTPDLDLVGIARFRAPPRLVGAEIDGVRLTPLGIERRLRLHGVPLTERICVAHDLPAAVYEWAAAAPVEIAVTWSLDHATALQWPGDAGSDGAGASATHRTESGPSASGGAPLPQRQAIGTEVILRFSRQPRRLDGVAPGATARAVFGLGAGAGVRIGIGGGSARELERVRRGLASPGSVVTARAAVIDRAYRHRLQVLAPDPRVDQGLAWAATVLEACAPSPDLRLWAGLAALAVGRTESGRALLRGSDAAALVAAWTGTLRPGEAPARSSGEEPLRFDPERIDGAPGGAAWGPYARERADSGFGAWLGTLSAGPAGEGRNAAPTARWATAVVLPLVHGLLGAFPDATLQRLRLRPRIPEQWDRLEVRGLRLADAEVGLRYEREGSLHRFRVRQEAGAVPLLLVFEPSLPGTLPGGARVDGRQADLEHESVGRRTSFGLQLVLDHERTVELHVREPC